MRANYKSNGKKRILIISGVHGDEHTPVAITNQIINTINGFSNNYSELTILHGINEPALQANSRYDGEFDLNRAFDGNHDDHALVQTIKSEIENTDVIIDIHSSKSCVELLAVDANEYAESFCFWANNLNIPCYLFKGSEGTIKRYCISQGKPCFTVEVNKLGEVDHESLKAGYNMLNNMIENIDSLELYPSNNIPPLNKSVKTKQNCIILPLVNKGDIIQPKQKIAIKIDESGVSKYLVSNEEKPCQVLTTIYEDYKNDSIILACNQHENISLFSIS